MSNSQLQLRGNSKHFLITERKVFSTLSQRLENSFTDKEMQMYATELTDFSITVTELRGQDLSAISGKRAWSMQPAVISHCHLKMVIEISVQQCTESHATFLNQDRSLVQVSSGRDHRVLGTHTKPRLYRVLCYFTQRLISTSLLQPNFIVCSYKAASLQHL